MSWPTKRDLENRISELKDSAGVRPDDLRTFVIEDQNAAGETVERTTITEQPDGSFESVTEHFDGVDYQVAREDVAEQWRPDQDLDPKP